MNYRACGIPAVLSTGIPGNALRAFPGLSGIFPEFLPESASRTGGMAHLQKTVDCRRKPKEAQIGVYQLSSVTLSVKRGPTLRHVFLFSSILDAHIAGDFKTNPPAMRILVCSFVGGLRFRIVRFLQGSVNRGSIFLAKGMFKKEVKKKRGFEKR